VDLLWTDFVNSLAGDWRGGGPPADHIGEPPWTAEFLSRWALQAPAPLGGADLQAARALRALLRDLAAQVAQGGRLDPEALNAFLARAPVRRALAGAPGGGYRLELLPGAVGWPAVLGEVAASFARTLAEGDPRRIHLCANPDCRWAFYDDTRGAAKRYCDEKTCGNLMRVRRFRSRKRAGE